MKFKNLTLHKITLTEDLQSSVEVVEPDLDKRDLIIDPDNIDEEFDRLLNLITPYLQSGDRVITGGHPLLCQAVITACMIKGAVPYMTKIDEFKRVYYLFRVPTYFDMDRKRRLELENTTIL